MRKLCMLTCIMAIVLLAGCNLIPLVNTPPVANFVCQTENPVVNSPVTFNASGSNDAEDGQNLAARWDLNADNVWDIDYSHGKKVTDVVTYTYTTAGTYTVKLEVRDLQNATHAITHSVVVTGNAQSLPPTASFVYSPTSPLVNQPVTFNPSGSSDPVTADDLLQVRWDFDGDQIWEIDYDEDYKANQTATCTYTVPGTYNVILEVKNLAGLTSTVQQTVIVYQTDNTIPAANFTSAPEQVYAGTTVTFDASGSNDVEDGHNLKARWDFNGDHVWEIEYTAGKTVTDMVSYTYTTSGMYDVTLEVKDAGGAIDTITKSIQVSDVPVDAGMIKGYLVESRGGSGIGGANLSLSKDNQVINLLTEADGAFQSYVEPGIYQLIFTKEGYATSKVQDLYVKANQTIQLDLPLKEKFSDSWTTNGPLITVHNLPQSNETTPLSGEYIFEIQVTASLGVKLIQVRLNNEGIEPEISFADTSIAEINLDTSLFMDGWNYLKISTYDANNNYTEMYMPVYVINNLPPLLLHPPTQLEVRAMTFGESLQIMGKLSEALMQVMGEKGYDLQRGLDAAKEANSTVAVALEWNDVPDAQGYKVYRSFDDESNYTWIGNAYTTFKFADLSAMITPGRKVFYRVSAFNGETESLACSSVYTIPLETFNVSLVSPAQDQTVTVPNPVLSWQYSRLVGDGQTYVIKVQGVTDGTPCMEDYVQNETSMTYSGLPLQSGKEYEWDIIQAVAEREYTSNGYAISVSGNDWSSVNGFYRFVTNF